MWVCYLLGQAARRNVVVDANYLLGHCSAVAVKLTLFENMACEL